MGGIFAYLLIERYSQRENHVPKLCCLGIGLSAIVLANLACAQAAPPSSRLRAAAAPRVTTPSPSSAVAATRGPSGGITPNSRSISAQSLPNASSNLKTSSEMNMMQMQNVVGRRGTEEQQIANIMNSMGNSQKTIAQNIGGGGAPPSGGNASAAVKAATVPYSASSRNVTSGTVLCHQCRAPANRAPAKAPPRP